MENKPFEKPERPLIDRPRYIYKPPTSADTGKKQTKKKVTNKKKQKTQKPVEQKLQDIKQPISGSLENKIVETNIGKPKFSWNEIPLSKNIDNKNEIDWSRREICAKGVTIMAYPF